jgi:hypothetical protein
MVSRVEALVTVDERGPIPNRRDTRPCRGLSGRAGGSLMPYMQEVAEIPRLRAWRTTSCTVSSRDGSWRPTRR